jgi:hypothetical protein
MITAIAVGAGIIALAVVLLTACWLIDRGREAAPMVIQRGDRDRQAAGPRCPDCGAPKAQRKPAERARRTLPPRAVPGPLIIPMAPGRQLLADTGWRGGLPDAETGALVTEAEADAARRDHSAYWARNDEGDQPWPGSGNGHATGAAPQAPARPAAQPGPRPASAPWPGPAPDTLTAFQPQHERTASDDTAGQARVTAAGMAAAAAAFHAAARRAADAVAKREAAPPPEPDYVARIKAAAWDPERGLDYQTGSIPVVTEAAAGV